MNYAILFAVTMPIGLVAFAVSKLHAAVPRKLRSWVVMFGGCGVVLLMAEVARLIDGPPPVPSPFLPARSEAFPANPAEFATMSASVLLTMAVLHQVIAFLTEEPGQQA